ncbi:hypothetical protein BDR07DRAFT_1494978 [Suillus spraguei]|nr:hypothetical protein BDR07DRAFT_1494978 [Suillus spraguei]
MHTPNNGGIDTNLAMDLDKIFAWTPPSASQIAATFDEIEQHIAEFPSATDPQLEGYEILAGKVYDLAELTKELSLRLSKTMLESDLEDYLSWDVQSLLTTKGVSSM